MNGEKNIRHLDLSSGRSNLGVVDMSKSGHSELDGHSGVPMSPSSAYAQKMLVGLPHCFLNAIVFCHWDNILGPRLEHVWYIQDRPEPHLNILRFITSQVLSGEICRELNTSCVDFKFFDIPDKGIVIPSFVFSARRGTDLGLHALALVIPDSELNLFLQVSAIMQTWCSRIISKFRVLLEKRDFSEEDMQSVSDWLFTFLQMLSSLQEARLPDTIHLSYTALCPSCNLEQDFLQQAIASHLMTFGRSIVVGRVPDRVNKVVHTLALFSWEAERVCSRLVVDGKHWPYAHDLFVQGILKNKDGSYDLPLGDLLYSKYPSTIIDVQKRDVKQSSSVSDHPHFSQAAVLEELTQLYNNTGQESSFTSVFQSADIPETLVRTLLDELHKLPVQSGIREAFVTHFMHLLQRKALALIKHVEVETQRGTHSLRGGLKKLRSDLHLPLEGDLRIVMATAEKLKPGLCQLLVGERRYDTEYLPNVPDLF
ncbi:guanine nucleotide exchange factor C9orf72-like [Babylonia areolata]|uniref:guanine nucleotide exchange factor C9orf72-like n=1 Tax=Babylonia areolata TaxID=304850 RepID=UPI003FD1F0FE